MQMLTEGPSLVVPMGPLAMHSKAGPMDTGEQEMREARDDRGDPGLPRLQGSAPLLVVDGLSKSFVGVPVLTDVDLTVRSGEFHALLGENGAGKSTLIKIIAGTYRADAGTVQVLSRETGEGRGRLGAQAGKPEGAASGGLHGVAFVHQDLALVPTMTVAENIAHVLGFPHKKGLIDWNGVAEQADRALRLVALDVSPMEKVTNLSRGEQALVAIARAVSLQASVLVLDEPTATLEMADVQRLFALLRQVQALGCGILYVTHRLDEVFVVADTVTVLRDGRRISSRAVAESSLDRLSAEIVGRPLSTLFPPRELTVEATGQGARVQVNRLICRDSASARLVGPVSMQARGGEIVGLVGLRGAGQELLAKGIRDRECRLEGEVTVESGAGRGRAEVAVVPSDRKAEGVFETLTLTENLFPRDLVWSQSQGSWPGWVRPRRERRAALELLSRFHVRPPDPSRKVETLSGGNQQKVVIARAVSSGASVLLLEEPTAGVDIGAKAEIYKLVREAAGAGRVVLVVSTDFEEVAGLCDRIYLFRGAQLVSELRGGETSRDHLARIAVGAEGEEGP